VHDIVAEGLNGMGSPGKGRPESGTGIISQVIFIYFLMCVLLLDILADLNGFLFLIGSTC
jgi:hypothetical protein